MGNISQSVFFFFVGELVSIMFAYIVKDEKKRIFILLIGTALSGMIAFGFQGRAFSFSPLISPVSESNFTTVASLPTEITYKKSVDMVFVPEGKFTMGSNPMDALVECQKYIENCQLDSFLYEREQSLNVDAFYIDKYEVTNILYKSCVEADGCQPPKDTTFYNNSKYMQHPVVLVDWHQANVFCEWRGARLPTEAEWEKAARGTDGRTYPWGEGLDHTLANYNNYVGDTTPVGSYESGKSPYGLYDMAGNVKEWTSGRENKGGSWNFSELDLRSSYTRREQPSGWFHGTGFRCANSP